LRVREDGTLAYFRLVAKHRVIESSGHRAIEEQAAA
jgi:hypothetical protein